MIIDAQSVKNTSSARYKGYDARKKVSGIKRHIAVDSQGLPHALLVTTAQGLFTGDVQWTTGEHRQSPCTLKSMQYKHAPAMINKRLTAYYDFFVSLVLVGKALQKRTLTFISLKPGQKYLDVGCGTGTLAYLVKSRHPKAVVVGADPDPVVLEVATKKVSRKNLSVEFTKAVAEKLPFHSNEFDVVTSSLAFHHMPLEVKKQALREIRRVLKPSGMFLLVDIGKPKNNLWRLLCSIEAVVEPKEYIKDNLAGAIPQLMRGVGFRVTDVRKPYMGICFWSGTLSTESKQSS